MVTERVEVVVTDRGSRVVRRNLESIGTAARGSEDAVRLLQRALGLVAAYAGVREIQRLADTYTNLQNRLRQVTTGTENLSTVTNKLFDIANRTRTAYEGTANLYARVALATKELGVSQQELLTFTERVNQAIILSGASAIEANNGLIQLSQGLASGVLRGDELRSVLEQLPAVADVITKHLKVTRGELRQMGADGKITTEIVLAAFRNADNVAKAFAETVPTVSQAFAVARNQFIRFIGETDKALGISENFARALISIATNMDVLAKNAAILAAGLATLFGPLVLLKGYNLLKSIFLLVARHPFLILASAVATLVARLLILNDEYDDFLKSMGRTAGPVARVVAAFAGARAYIEQAWADFPEWFGELIDSAVTAAIKALSRIGSAISEAAIGDAKQGQKILNTLGIPTPQYAKRALDVAEGDWKRQVEKLNFELPADALKRNEENGKKAAMAYRQAYAQTLTDMSTITDPNVLNPGGDGSGGNKPGGVDSKALSKLQRELDRVVSMADPTADAWRDLAKAQDVLNRAWGAGLITLDQYNDLNGQVYRSLEKQLFPVQAYIDDLGRQRELLMLDIQARERANAIYQLEEQLRRKLTAAEREQLDAELKLTQARALEADILDQVRGPQEEYYRTKEALLNLVGNADLSSFEYQQELLKADMAYYQAYPSVANNYKAALAEIQLQQLQLNQALQDNVLSLDQFNARMAQTVVQTAQLNLTTGEGGIGDVFTASLSQLIEGFEGASSAISDILGDLWSNLSSGFADSIGRAVVYAEDLGTALKDVARSAISQLISALVQLGIQWVVSQALAAGLGTAAVAISSLQAATTAAAWAPAAALASLATLGANAIPANAALIGTVSLAKVLGGGFGGGSGGAISGGNALTGMDAVGSIPGFAGGGYTGDSAVDKIAGLVHGQEFVMNAAATARNRPALEAMNRGENASSAGGGWSGNVILINETGVEMEASEVRYTTSGDVEVIARRVMREESPRVVARDLDNQNGPMRKSLARNTNVQSKRNGNA